MLGTEAWDMQNLHEVIAPGVVHTGIRRNKAELRDHELKRETAELAGEGSDENIAL